MAPAAPAPAWLNLEALPLQIVNDVHADQRFVLDDEDGNSISHAMIPIIITRTPTPPPDKR